MFTPAGKLVRSIGSSGGAAGQFDYPIGIATLGNHVYVSEYTGRRVQVRQPAMRSPRSMADGPHTPLRLHAGGSTHGGALHPRAQVFSQKGELLHVLKLRFGQMGRLSGIHVTGRHVYVADWDRNGIHVLLRVPRRRQATKTDSLPAEDRRGPQCPPEMT